MVRIWDRGGEEGEGKRGEGVREGEERREGRRGVSGEGGREGGREWRSRGEREGRMCVSVVVLEGADSDEG